MLLFGTDDEVPAHRFVSHPCSVETTEAPQLLPDELLFIASVGGALIDNVLA